MYFSLLIAPTWHMQSFVFSNEQTVMNIVADAHKQQIPYLLFLTAPLRVANTAMCRTKPPNMLHLNAGNVKHDLCGRNAQLARVVHQQVREAAHWCDDKYQCGHHVIKKHTLR